MNVILGSSGYLGLNITEYFKPNDIVTVSQNKNSFSVKKHFQIPTWSHNINAVIGSIPAYKPKRLVILARPPTLEYEANEKFYSELKLLCLELIRKQSLQRIDFFSTLMVYEGKGLIRSSRNAETVPFSAYEYFKLDFELFLKFLCVSENPNLSASVYRLPLLFGGRFCAKKNGQQFIYKFLRQYEDGMQWRFSGVQSKKYGSSWAFVPDLCKAVVNSRSGPGFRILNVASGFFTYHELHQELVRLKVSEKKEEMDVTKSRFQVVDELGLPRRNLGLLLSRFQKSENSND
jgi:nucleoside-diphosphate-sugar epimerase